MKTLMQKWLPSCVKKALPPEQLNLFKSQLTIMNEAETRAERIDPALKQAGWGVMADSKILREYPITAGKLQSSGGRSKKWIADYILVYKGIKLAVVEAKSDELAASEGVAQAKLYAEKLKLETTYATNGKAIYQICMKTGAEGEVHRYLSPDELWQKTFPDPSDWRAILEYFSAAVQLGLTATLENNFCALSKTTIKIYLRF
jgi:type I site-specific restriction endonuclease